MDKLNVKEAAPLLHESLLVVLRNMIILTIFLCCFLSNAHSQEVPKAELFINIYFLNKLKMGSTGEYFLYEYSMKSVENEELSLELLKRNYTGKFNIGDPNEFYRPFPIEKILDTDNLNFIKGQLKELDAEAWDNSKFIDNISIVKTNKGIEEIALKMLRNKKFAHKTKSVYQFSHPVYSQDKTVAMVFVDTYSSRAQGGDIVIFQKSNDQWEIKCFYERWTALYD